MLSDVASFFSIQIQNIEWLITIITVILHLIFSGAVAKDAGGLDKMSQKTALVSGTTWAFATLLGGVFVAAIYWFIHHSTLTITTLRDHAQHE